jgi:antitoxin Phd
MEARRCQGAVQRSGAAGANRRAQRVTVRGKDAVIVISVEELERLLPAKERVPFVEFMESLHVPSLDLSRESDRGRDPKL